MEFNSQKKPLTSSEYAERISNKIFELTGGKRPPVTITVLHGIICNCDIGDKWLEGNSTGNYKQMSLTESEIQKIKSYILSEYKDSSLA